MEKSRRKQLIIGLLASGVLWGSSAHADNFSFKAKARIYCPAWLVDGKIDKNFTTSPDPMPVNEGPNAFFQTSTPMVPCAGIKVVAMDQDSDWDDYCGSAYTDASGYVTIKGTCGDPASGPNIYLQVQAIKKDGLQVGVHGWGFWQYLGHILELLVEAPLDSAFNFDGGYAAAKDVGYDFMTSNDVFYWNIKEDESVDITHNGQVVDFGAWNVGNTRPEIDDRSYKCGLALFAGDYALKKIARSKYRPQTPIITVNNPLYGAPTTVWHWVNWKDSSDYYNTSKYLSDVSNDASVTPHEFGHITFNRYHSSWDHYYDDFMKYMHSHDNCSDVSSMFGWYEGFAEWVDEYAYSVSLDKQDPSDHLVHKDGYAKVTGCPGAKGFQIEGNVNAALGQIFFGDFFPGNSGYRYAGRSSESIRVPAVKIGGSASEKKFITPSAGRMFKFVQDAGSGAHALKDVWESTIRPYCYGDSWVIDPDTSKPFPRYCSSQTFINRTKTLGSGGLK